VKFIRKILNWFDNDESNKSFGKAYVSIYVLIFLIFSLVYLNYLFNFDMTEDYKCLSNAMEENRSNVEQLLTQYDYSSFNTKENYHITCSKSNEQVSITSNKHYFLIGNPEINYSVAKKNDAVVMSDTYTETGDYKVQNAICFIFILIVVDLVLAVVLLVLLLALLEIIIYVDDKIKSNKKKLT
jgi:hypothetical protein